MTNPRQGEEIPGLPGAIFGKVYHEYPQFGLTSVQVLLKNKGAPKIDTGRRFVFKNGDYRADVSQRYKLLANEEAINIADRIANEIGFKQLKYFESKGGNIVHSTYIDKNAVSGIPHTLVEPMPGDGINLGFSIRNSIDGSTSYGAQLFSFRSVCSNGAIIGIKNLAMAPLKRHTGKMEEFVKELTGNLKKFLEANLEPLAQFYKSLPSIEVNLAVAKAITAAIPVRYLPDFIEVERKTKKITLTSRSVDAFTAYNSITEALWHSQKADMKSQTTYMTNLHAMLQPLIVPLVT
jgi:hypothetical protein